MLQLPDCHHSCAPWPMPNRIGHHHGASLSSSVIRCQSTSGADTACTHQTQSSFHAGTPSHLMEPPWRICARCGPAAGGPDASSLLADRTTSVTRNAMPPSTTVCPESVTEPKKGEVVMAPKHKSTTKRVVSSFSLQGTGGEGFACCAPRIMEVLLKLPAVGKESLPPCIGIGEGMPCFKETQTVFPTRACLDRR